MENATCRRRNHRKSMPDRPPPFVANSDASEHRVHQSALIREFSSGFPTETHHVIRLVFLKKVSVLRNYSFAISAIKANHFLAGAQVRKCLSRSPIESTDFFSITIVPVIIGTRDALQDSVFDNIIRSPLCLAGESNSFALEPIRKSPGSAPRNRKMPPNDAGPLFLLAFKLLLREGSQARPLTIICDHRTNALFPSST